MAIERDTEAESAVREAIEELVAAGKRAYSLSVPHTAEQFLIRSNRGRLRAADASNRIRAAIVAMAGREEIEAHSEGHLDWRIVEHSEAEHENASKNSQQNSKAISGTSESEKEWDVFLSHASEDKEEFVRPLAEKLESFGLKVWFDQFTLTIGDSLRRSIDQGLVRSRIGIVVISPSFLKKEWPQKELDGLVSREIAGTKIILPVWHEVDFEQVCSYSPTLADKYAARSSDGLETVSRELLRAIKRSKQSSTPLEPLSTSEKTTASVAFNAGDFKVAGSMHRTRVEKIHCGSGPVAVLDGSKLVMHIVPLGVSSQKVATSIFQAIAENPEKFPPMKDKRPRDSQITYDGLLTGSNADGLSKPQRACVHVSRSAVVESIISSLEEGRDSEYIILPYVEALIIGYAFKYLSALGGFGIEPPFGIFASLLDVDGRKLLQDFVGNNVRPEDVPCGTLHGDKLVFGEAIVSKMPIDHVELATMLEPILTHLANASGLPSSPYFDSDGLYTLSLG